MFTASFCYLYAIICITVTITTIYQKLLSAHSLTPFPLSLQSRQQASLSPSLSFLPACLCPITFAANAALSTTVKFPRFPHPLPSISPLYLFFSRLTCPQPASTNSCPAAVCPSLFVLCHPLLLLTPPFFSPLLFFVFCSYSWFSSLNSCHSPFFALA